MADKHASDPAIYRVIEERAGSASVYLTECFWYRPGSNYDLTGLRFKAPEDEFGEVLVIINAIDVDGTPVVAFHAGATFGEALVGVASRLRNGKLNWKVDKYAVERSKG